MKNKKSLLIALVALGLTSLGLLSSHTSSGLIQANILEENPNIELERSGTLKGAAEEQQIVKDLLKIDVTSEAPDSPDFLNTFNIYKDIKSELAMVRAYRGQIQGEMSLVHEQYMPEILSYVYRLANSPYVSNKLPMWPEYNVATVGHTLAYLFPQEANPLLFAKGLGIVPLDAKSQSYLSRSEFVDMVGDLFIKDGSDPYELLASNGFIDSQTRWKETSKEGFLLVDAVRIILNIRELVERENIQESKKRYERQLADLGEGSAVLSEESLEVLMLAFVNELRDDKGAPHIPPSVRKKMQEVFGVRYGVPLDATNVTEARELFFQAMNKPAPDVYELPSLVTVGSCDYQMFRKMYVGAVAVTGPLGASIICDQAMIQFPANAYLLNVHSLPKITSSLDTQGRHVVRTDSLRSYKNTLLLSPNGEERVRIAIRPEGVEKMIGEEYELLVKEQNSDESFNHIGSYEADGAVIRTHLRQFTGDNFIMFDKSR